MLVITKASLNWKARYLGVLYIKMFVICDFDMSGGSLFHEVPCNSSCCITVKVCFNLVKQHQNTMYTLHRCDVFCQVAGMFQDPSIGNIKVYYVVTKIIVLTSTDEQVRISYNCPDVID